MAALDACAPAGVHLAADDAALAAPIARALAAWNVTASATEGDALHVAWASGGGGVELGFYDGAAGVIDVSDSLAGRAGDAAALDVVVEHELGHAFGLVHVARAERTSVMNPGNATVAVTPADRDALGCAK